MKRAGRNFFSALWPLVFCLAAAVRLVVFGGVPSGVGGGIGGLGGQEDGKPAKASGTALDLQGNPADPFKNSARVTVLVFLSIECPISNRYAPEIQRLAERFESKGAKFWLIYPEADMSAAAVEKHLKDYRYSIRALRDPSHFLVDRAKARVTPEAAVFGADGRLLYRGRIDDRFVDFGKQRSVPTRHDLREAVDAALANKPIALETTPAIGCSIFR